MGRVLLGFLFVGCGNTSTLMLTGVGAGGAPDTLTLYALGGSVFGLEGSGLELTLNDSRTLAINRSGSFTFDAALASGSAYFVSVKTQPVNPRQRCRVENASGTIGTTAVDTLVIRCVNTYVVSGSVSGLAANTSLGLTLDGGNELSISANGAFAFAETSEDFRVELARQPRNPRQQCTFSPPQTPAEAASIAISCWTPTWVFVTSTRGNGNLASWPDALGKSGVAGADQICNSRAAAAGLGGAYVAWISDATTDAYCHVFGLSGRKSDACGRDALPAQSAVGPWYTSELLPYALNIEQALSARAYYPLQSDESGKSHGDFFAWTGTQAAGEVSASGTCADWTSASSAPPNAALGRAGTNLGVAGVGSPCAYEQPLFCFQRATAPPFDPPVALHAADKRMFVTKASGTADLSTWSLAGGQGGLTAGDAICQNSAAAAGMNGTFVAYLGTEGARPHERLSHEGPWRRVDGALVATKADLAANRVLTSPSLDESGAPAAGWEGAWTGALAAHCTGWTSGANTATADVGYPTFSTALAFVSAPVTCEKLERLYCFEL